MSLKTSLRAGIKSSFAAAHNDDSEKAIEAASKLQDSVKTLANSLCKLKKDDGKSMFSKANGKWPSGIKYIVLHSMGEQGSSSISLNMSSDAPKTRIEAKIALNVAASEDAKADEDKQTTFITNTWHTSNEQDALKFIAYWAGIVAPEIQEKLEDALDAFELQQSFDNGEWDNTPTHT